jgi:hypothetical protein
LRTNYPGMKNRFQLIETTFREKLRLDNVAIDYPHLGMDCEYGSGKLDRELYSKAQCRALASLRAATSPVIANHAAFLLIDEIREQGMAR